MSDDLQRLYPTPGPFVALEGLYLNSGLRECADDGPLVYTNFIASIDGRIALAQPDGHHQIPGAITNKRDWRLFQELAALSDVLITTGRYLRTSPTTGRGMSCRSVAMRTTRICGLFAATKDSAINPRWPS